MADEEGRKSLAMAATLSMLCGRPLLVRPVDQTDDGHPQSNYKLSTYFKFISTFKFPFPLSPVPPIILHTLQPTLKVLQLGKRPFFDRVQVVHRQIHFHERLAELPTLRLNARQLVVRNAQPFQLVQAVRPLLVNTGDVVVVELEGLEALQAPEAAVAQDGDVVPSQSQDAKLTEHSGPKFGNFQLKVNSEVRRTMLRKNITNQ
jgi:hypothetical protein